ncbi:MAG: peptide deformylase [Planctomycetes bacterium]|nr:peptide deformylase [Planctomycetota bacterium]
MELVTYPHPALLEKTRAVDSFDAELRARVAEMFRIMREFKGVGLAAPQVAWPVRLLVVNPTGEPAADEVLVNPVIKRKRGRVAGEEGCLSFPGIFVQVERAKEIEVEYFDLDGKKHAETRTDFPARVIQHEVDHLESILLVHRMSPADRVRVKRDLQALVQKGA